MWNDFDGRHVQCRHPNWQPLVDLVGEELADDFMWMDELELSNGRRVHAYKHRATRRYLYLSVTGTAFMYTASDQYRPVPAHGQLAMLLYDWAFVAPQRAPNDGDLALLQRAEHADVEAHH
jgi:hypothetical protein